MKKLKVTVRNGGIPTEQIVEFSGSDGRGGLISIAEMPDGTVRVEAYRLDKGVEVRAPGKEG